MRWKQSLKEQIGVLECLVNLDSLDREIEKQMGMSKKISGFHYFTGIGKNGFVAEKVASTFNSLGIRSMFIHPVDTLHGDMNIFQDTDILIMLSKSGETHELIAFATALINNGFNKIIVVTSKNNSTLVKMALHHITVPVSKEADHLNMAPMASSLAYMAVLQAMGAELSFSSGFTKKDFVKGHPGGSLGKAKVD